MENKENMEREINTIEEARKIIEIDLRPMNQMKGEMMQSTEEMRNYVVLDTSCKRSIVGMPWLEAYMKDFGKDIEVEMKDLTKSNEIFKLRFWEMRRGRSCG